MWKIARYTSVHCEAKVIIRMRTAAIRAFFFSELHALSDAGNREYDNVFVGKIIIRMNLVNVSNRAVYYI